MLKKLLTPFQFGMRSAIADAVLVGNAFVWYYIVLIILLQEEIVPSQATLIWALHFGGLILSAIAGTFISKKVEQRKLITYWLLFGTLSSLAVIVINPSDISQVSIIALLMGVSLGFGMPTCISRYANSIPVENRGRVSGITLFASGIGILVFSVLGINGTLIVGAILTIWRLAGLIIFLSTSAPAYDLKQKKPDVQYSKIIRQHSFILYFIPWVMFSLINYLIAPAPTEESTNISIVQLAFIGLFALLGGFFIDSMGRKRIAIVGFILLGLGTALVGMSNGDSNILYLNAILNGTAFGLLLILFILTLWSDLSFAVSSEKYYALGVTPFFVSKFLELTIGSSLLHEMKNSQALFSFGAFFLFLAVLPLVYAPETLPEKAMKDRDIKSYIEKAQKIVQKKNGKDQTSQSQDKEALKQNEENDEKYAEALKLAEKYY